LYFIALVLPISIFNAQKMLLVLAPIELDEWE
jgi:hypothetical protein